MHVNAKRAVLNWAHYLFLIGLFGSVEGVLALELLVGEDFGVVGLVGAEVFVLVGLAAALFGAGVFFVVGLTGGLFAVGVLVTTGLAGGLFVFVALGLVTRPVLTLLVFGLLRLVETLSFFLATFVLVVIFAFALAFAFTLVVAGFFLAAAFLAVFVTGRLAPACFFNSVACASARSLASCVSL
jgi:hypothetical protein